MTKKNTKSKKNIKKKIRLKKKPLIFIITIILILVLSIIISLLIKDYNEDTTTKELEDIQIDSELIYDEVKLEDSGIKGEDIEVDTTYNIYYTFLNEDEQKLYKQIYANAINLKKAFIPFINTDVDTVLKVYQFVTYDYPELFWLDNGFSCKYNKDKTVKQITLKYNNLINNYENNKQKFDDVVNNILENASNITDDYEKEKYVYNAIIKVVRYDIDANYSQTIYSALVNNLTVCAGYSKAFQYLMNRLGIPTYYVVGVAEDENHAWNIVKLSDGYYNVDLTWNNGYGSFYYFNMTDKEFNKSHTRGEYSKQLPSCNVTTYSYSNTTSTPVKNTTSNENTSSTISNNTPSNQSSSNNSTQPTKSTTSDTSKTTSNDTSSNSTKVPTPIYQEIMPEEENTTEEYPEDDEYGKVTDVTNKSDSSNTHR